MELCQLWAQLHKKARLRVRYANIVQNGKNLLQNKN